MHVKIHVCQRKHLAFNDTSYDNPPKKLICFNDHHHDTNKPWKMLIDKTIG